MRAEPTGSEIGLMYIFSVIVEISSDVVAGTLTTARATRTPVADMALRIGGDAHVDKELHVTVDAWARGGRRLTDAPIDYAIAVTPGESSDAEISSDGVFVAHTPGVYTIIAAVDGKADQQTLLVRD